MKYVVEFFIRLREKFCLLTAP